MGTSWIDYYNLLTSGSQQLSQQRKNNFFKLDYSAAGAPVPGVGRSTPKKQNKDLVEKLRWVPGISSMALLRDVISGDKTTPGQRILDVMSRPAFASANYVQKLTEQLPEDGGVGQINIFDPEAL